MVYIIPFVILGIVLYSFVKKGDTYGSFIEGANNALLTVKNIFAPILAISVASSMLRASGALELLSSFLSPILSCFNIPSEIVPLSLIKPLSGSGAIGVLTDILSQYGPDSRVGMIASIIMASTETTFYCISIYFAKTGIKNTARVVPCAVAGDVCALLLACWLVR